MSEYGTSAAFSTSFDSASSDPLAGIFEPDVVLPAQFFDRTAGGLLDAERKLMAAILSDGIEAFISQAVKGNLAESEAGDWVHTRDYSYVFSFDSVCQSLGIDPDYLRLGLRRYVARLGLQLSNGERPKRLWKKIRRPRK